MTEKRLILASTSRYRAELLARLGLPFEQQAPVVDETPKDGESTESLAARLGMEKARAVHDRFPDCIVIAGDQVADFNGEQLGKPGSRRHAEQQLARISGRTVRFLSSLVVIAAEGREYSDLVTTEVQFRNLTGEEIRRYLDREPALDCAGSFKSEGLGISLCAAIRGDDPSALIGLPLIRLSEFLRLAGVTLP